MLKRLQRLTTEDITKYVCYDITDGYGSIQNTYKPAREINDYIELDDVKTILNKQPNKHIYKTQT
jgi:hypothetical protein